MGLAFYPSLLVSHTGSSTMGRSGLTQEEFYEKARANGYIPGAHEANDTLRNRVSYTTKTFKDQNKILDRWIESLRGLSSADGTSEFTQTLTTLQPPGPGVPYPDFAVIKDFLRDYVARSKGRLDPKRPCADSVVAYAEWFFAGFTRVTGNELYPDDPSEVYHVSLPNPERCRM
ncbi:MAG: hypothetical protein Q9181_003005 [Wetmoreana brouardii]